MDKWWRWHKNSRGIISLSVTNLPDRRFFSNSPARMHNSAQIDTPVHPAHARRGDLLSAVLQTYAQPVPAFQPNETFMTCLTQPFCFFRTFLLYFFEYWKGRWNQHQRSDRHIQVPTDHFWGHIGGFYRTMPQCRRIKVLNCVWVLLTFLEVCKLTT